MLSGSQDGRVIGSRSNVPLPSPRFSRDELNAGALSVLGVEARPEGRETKALFVDRIAREHFVCQDYRFLSPEKFFLT